MAEPNFDVAAAFDWLRAAEQDRVDEHWRALLCDPDIANPLANVKAAIRGLSVLVTYLASIGDGSPWEVLGVLERCWTLVEAERAVDELAERIT